jgi:hypothetical protein
MNQSIIRRSACQGFDFWARFRQALFDENGPREKVTNDRSVIFRFFLPFFIFSS